MTAVPDIQDGLGLVDILRDTPINNTHLIRGDHFQPRRRDLKRPKGFVLVGMRALRWSNQVRFSPKGKWHDSSGRR
jgi:hypothetical protein